MRKLKIGTIYKWLDCPDKNRDKRMIVKLNPDNTFVAFNCSTFRLVCKTGVVKLEHVYGNNLEEIEIITE